ncbi:MAG: hypothetical protein JXA19_03495 [Anaerolineales bacterium]|nr:hypothetical protein [Anaerolineales bacterium]
MMTSFFRKGTIPIVLLILSIIFSGCGALQLAETPGELLVNEDFSNPKSGWNELLDDKGYAGYVDEQYVIYIQTPGYYLWSEAIGRFSNIIIEVEVKHPGEAQGDLFGVTCSGQRGGFFYAFLISSDGYFGIFENTDNGLRLIGDEIMQTNENIQRGKATNLIRAECLRNQLTLYVNDSMVKSIPMSEVSRGAVGLIGGTLDASESEFRFDQFSVQSP